MILQEYFNWLCEKISGPGIYSKLLSYLHNIAFRWTIINDQNRALDGRNLRKSFAAGNMDVYWELDARLPELCSVFEMFVAIAIRCEDNIMHNPFIGTNNTDRWFWIPLDNLGLLYFDDGRFDLDAVSDIVWRWLSHDYSYNGVGGPYPLKQTEEDLRHVEIWGQLSRYLNENFDI